MTKQDKEFAVGILEISELDGVRFQYAIERYRAFVRCITKRDIRIRPDRFVIDLRDLLLNYKEKYGKCPDFVEVEKLLYKMYFNGDDLHDDKES